MANEQYAFLTCANVPTREKWQEAIDECGFDFQLDPDLNPTESVGFVPCTLVGADAGCEMYFYDSSEFLAEFGKLADRCDCCISFRWGGSMRECATAMIASFALAKHSGAIVSYGGEEPYEDMSAFLRDTKAIIEDAMKES